MNRAVKYVDVLGNVRWQPQRTDGLRYYTSIYIKKWCAPSPHIGSPVLYRWKWRAALQAKISEHIKPPAGRWKEAK